VYEENGVQETFSDFRCMFTAKPAYNIILNNNLMNNVSLHSDRSIVWSMEAPLL